MLARAASLQVWRNVSLAAVAVLVAETLLVLRVSASRGWHEPLLLGGLLIALPLRRAGGARALELSAARVLRSAAIGVGLAAAGIRPRPRALLAAVYASL